MNIKRAAETLKEELHELCMADDEVEQSYPQHLFDAYKMAIEALDKQTPKMLTIDELKQMHGKPVYLQFGDEPEGVWGICDIFKDTFTFYSLLGESNPDTDLYDLKYNDPDGHFGLHVLGWRAWSGEPKEETEW